MRRRALRRHAMAQITRLPMNPLAYDAPWAHQSARNLLCSSGFKVVANSAGTGAQKNPTRPETTAQIAIKTASFQIIGATSRKSN